MKTVMRTLFHPTLLLFSLLTSLFANDSAQPDPKQTPGDWAEGVTIEQLQEISYSKRHRHISKALRRAVLADSSWSWSGNVLLEEWACGYPFR
jgi:hypothetical protein